MAGEADSCIVQHTCAVSDTVIHAHSVVPGEWAVSQLSKPGIRSSPPLVDCALSAPALMPERISSKITMMGPIPVSGSRVVSSAHTHV